MHACVRDSGCGLGALLVVHLLLGDGCGEALDVGLEGVFAFFLGGLAELPIGGALGKVVGLFSEVTPTDILIPNSRF